MENPIAGLSPRTALKNAPSYSIRITKGDCESVNPTALRSLKRLLSKKMVILGKRATKFSARLLWMRRERSECSCYAASRTCIEAFTSETSRIA